jgi:hypothetical protein
MDEESRFCPECGSPVSTQKMMIDAKTAGKKGKIADAAGWQWLVTLPVVFLWAGFWTWLALGGDSGLFEFETIFLLLIAATLPLVTNRAYQEQRRMEPVRGTLLKCAQCKSWWTVRAVA